VTWVGHSLRPDFNLTGLSRGGQQIQKSRDTYVKAVGTLVELASLQVGLSSALGHASPPHLQPLRWTAAVPSSLPASPRCPH
jgi:hypothetical protein